MPFRTLLGIVTLGALLAGGWCFKEYSLQSSGPLAKASEPRLLALEAVSRVIAPGKIEPDGEERLLSFDGSGILRKVHVQEGAEVKKGDLLAETLNDEQQARLEIAERVLDKTKTQLELLIKGPRIEDLNEARAESQAWQANMEMYTKTLEIREKLRPLSAVSLEDLEEIRSKNREASQRHEAAKFRFLKLQAGARLEEIAIARLEVSVAKARMMEARAALDRTRLLAPMNGTIIRLLKNEGEAVSSIEPVPVILMANLSRLFVRVEIDETEYRLLRLGMPVVCQEKRANAVSYEGTLVKILGRMGRRHLQTDDPHELVDRRVLEVLAELKGLPDLRLQQRVDVIFPITPVVE